MEAVNGREAWSVIHTPDENEKEIKKWEQKKGKKTINKGRF